MIDFVNNIFITIILVHTKTPYSSLQQYILPANIRLDEDVLKTSFLFAFKRRLQNVLMMKNIFLLIIRLQKTSWSRPIYSSCPYIFKTSSRRLQDIFKTSSRRRAKTFWRRLQNIFKTSRKYVFKTSSRRFEDVSSS